MLIYHYHLVDYTNGWPHDTEVATQKFNASSHKFTHRKVLFTFLLKGILNTYFYLRYLIESSVEKIVAVGSEQ